MKKTFKVRSLLVTHYSQLLQLVKKELREGLKRTQALVNRQRVITYWNIGRLIAVYSSRGDARLKKQSILPRLANDLGFSVDYLRRMYRFYESYPHLPSRISLSWNQYRALLHAPASRRPYLEKRAIEQDLGRDRIRRLIRTPGAIKAPQSLSRLKLEKGRLYTYTVVRTKLIALESSQVLVDCGFHTFSRVRMDVSRKFVSGEIVLSVKKDQGYLLKHSQAQRDELYTYQAIIDRVVDGDTLLVYIDKGFDIWGYHRLRLKGIDTPELSTYQGRQAKEFVKSKLKGKPFIIIKTHKTDKYGRYLADVFYGHNGMPADQVAQNQGHYLNQQLLDHGLASRYGEGIRG